MDIGQATAAVRQFNRFYTRTLGLLDETLTESAFTLTEARVLFEIGAGDHRAASRLSGEAGFLAEAFAVNVRPAATDIARQLQLDAAYLARILRKFAAAGLTTVRADPEDGRRRILGLTSRGLSALAGLQAAADRDVARLIESLPGGRLERLVHAMRAIESSLAGKPAPSSVVLRAHRPGDVGWVIGRQASLYAVEYGWDISFEALLAEIGGAFIRNFREGRDYCWIAEEDGERVGAVFLVGQDDETAKLRMLHVEACARGQGIGRRLVAACVAQARDYGYRRLVLWTNDILTAARSIYETEGFRLVSSEAHRSFGKDLVGQTWERNL